MAISGLHSDGKRAAYSSWGSWKTGRLRSAGVLANNIAGDQEWSEKWRPNMPWELQVPFVTIESACG